MARWLILRRELGANAIDAIKQLYVDKMAEVQTVVSGDGQTKIADTHLAAYTPRFDMMADGLQASYKCQMIDLELHAVCDYQNRLIAPKFEAICEALEDFCARTDLKTHLTSAESDGIQVDQVTPDAAREESDDQRFLAIYTLRCMVRSKA
jgi:hypothetical protein